MLPPESASAEEVGREIGVSADTLGRWRSQALARPAREKVWMEAARFDAVLTTAAMDENAKGSWCRANGVYLKDLTAWRQSGTQALASPEEERASPNQTKQDRRRIKELERDLRRKNAALSETTVLLVLSKNSRRSSKGRGRMISLEDRQGVARDILTAHSAGARLQFACETASIDVRMLQRCKAGHMTTKSWALKALAVAIATIFGTRPRTLSAGLTKHPGGGSLCSSRYP